VLRRCGFLNPVARYPAGPVPGLDPIPDIAAGRSRTVRHRAGGPGREGSDDAVADAGAGAHVERLGDADRIARIEIAGGGRRRSLEVVAVDPTTAEAALHAIPDRSGHPDRGDGDFHRGADTGPGG